MIAFAFCSYSAALHKSRLLSMRKRRNGRQWWSLACVSSSSPSDFVAQGHAVVDVDRRL